MNIYISTKTVFLINYETDTVASNINNNSVDQQQTLLSHNGSYKGTPWRNDRTISVKTLAETKFARCDVHTVQSEDGKGMVNDWIFMEEMDAVNVIVSTVQNKFVVFKQGKYAIPGDTLSPVGGFVDKGEAPFESARREVIEELGLGSRNTLKEILKVTGSSGKTAVNTDNKAAFSSIPKRHRSEDDFGLADGAISGDDEQDWVFLGRYRTAANRGGGFIYTYLLKNAVPIIEKGGTAEYQATGDDEAQEIQFLTLDEIQNHVLKGHFQEVKWAATIALALLHLQSEQ